MTLEKNNFSSLVKALPTLDTEEIEKAMILKYYDDSIVLENNHIIDLSKYTIETPVDSGLSLDLPEKQNVYYYNNDFKDQYYFLKGSKHSIEKSYLNKLKVKDIDISFKTDGNLIVNSYVVEYYNSEIIDILETDRGSITFQPSDQADEFEILFKFQGEGIIYNFNIDYKDRQRPVLGRKSLTIRKEDFFLNPRLIHINDENSLNHLTFNVTPNDKKHIYISYLERNNKYSELPEKSILEGIDLSSNILIEFNILKDETLDVIPMLIEYDQERKIGIKNLNIYSPEIYSLKSGTENVRLAFRVSGYGSMKIGDVKFLSLTELPKRQKLNFVDRSEVVKLLAPIMKLNEFKIASIMDEFTYNSFAPEVQLYKLDYNKWKTELLFIQPDLLFIESAWVGNNGKWHRKVAYYDDEQHKDIKELINFAKSLKIPVIFWNKEDPVHYDRFIETAKLCDFVFTTDKGRVRQYIKDCGHNNVEALPFAAQPKNHNPIKIQKERDPRVSFAGSYYRHHEERSRDMDILLEASKEIGLVIYDRNYEKTRKGQMPNHKFPERYEPYIEGTLPFNLIDKSYKGFKYMINVNTVKYSETMFSRRVFEGLLSGTPIISTYSLGMKKMFGNIINASSNINELKLHLNELSNDEELYGKYALKGIREVLLHHTYEKRMKQILKRVGYNILSSKVNAYFIAFVENEVEIEEYQNIYESQTVSNKKLVIIHKNIQNYKEFYNKYNTEETIGIDYSVLKKYINIRQLLGEGYILVLNKKNFYAENYALDLILAKEYSEADIIGKSMFYTKTEDGIKLYNQNDDYIYSHQIKIDRCAVNVSVFDKFSVKSSLKYLEGRETLESLAPFGAKMFSADSLNFIENGSQSNEIERKQVQV